MQKVAGWQLWGGHLILSILWPVAWQCWLGKGSCCDSVTGVMTVAVWHRHLSNHACCNWLCGRRVWRQLLNTNVWCEADSDSGS